MRTRPGIDIEWHDHSANRNRVFDIDVDIDIDIDFDVVPVGIERLGLVARQRVQISLQRQQPFRIAIERANDVALFLDVGLELVDLRLLPGVLGPELLGIGPGFRQPLIHRQHLVPGRRKLVRQSIAIDAELRDLTLQLADPLSVFRALGLHVRAHGLGAAELGLELSHRIVLLGERLLQTIDLLPVLLGGFTRVSRTVVRVVGRRIEAADLGGLLGQP